jgi:hypothetical protein
MATLSVLYFFDIKEDQEQVFIENWSNLPHKAKKYSDAMSGACASIKTLEAMKVLVGLIREEAHKP